MANRKKILTGLIRILSVFLLVPFTNSVQAQAKKPNIVVIMGDDIGWLNMGCYNQGLMATRTPNLDKLASEGMRFTDIPKQVALRVAQTLLHANCRFVPG